MDGDRDLALTAQLAMFGADARNSPKALDVFGGIPNDLPATRESAGLYQALGHAQIEIGRFADAVVTFRRAQAIRAQILPADHVERLVGDYEVAAALVIHHDHAEALPMLQRVRTALDLRVAPLRREAIDVLRLIGMAESLLGHAEAAIAADREVVARRTQLFGEHAAMTAVAREELAGALDSGGYWSDGATQRELAIADELAASGPKSVNAAEARVNLATDYTELGRYADAIAALGAARPLLVAAKGEAHVDVAIADLALAHARIGDAAVRHVQTGLADAEAILDRVTGTFTTSFGASSQPMAVVLELRGLLEAARGRWAAADRAYVAALAALGAGGAPADRASIELEHADALGQLGRHAEARASADAAAADYVKAGEGFGPRVVAARAWSAAAVH